MTPPTPPAAFVTGLFETHLNVMSLERSVDFYEKILGLTVAFKDPGRRLAFYWLGPPGRSFLGLWEKPAAEIQRQHLAFEVSATDLNDAVEALAARGLTIRNFFSEPTKTPSVFGWIPAASVYFDDPDGHLLEFIARLPEAARPDAAVVSLDDWNALMSSQRR